MTYTTTALAAGSGRVLGRHLADALDQAGYGVTTLGHRHTNYISPTDWIETS